LVKDSGKEVTRRYTSRDLRKKLILSEIEIYIKKLLEDTHPFILDSNKYVHIQIQIFIHIIHNKRKNKNYYYTYISNTIIIICNTNKIIIKY
jgi:hypothetical protein